MNFNGRIALVDVEPGDKIVISGIAGRFPESNNIKYFQENLFNKVDLGSDNYQRWQQDYQDIPRRTGKISNMEKFDAEYFGISANQAHLMDPTVRCLLEHTYEAIVDAGINPKDLRDTRTGAIIGISHLELENEVVYNKSKFTGFETLGSTKSMMGNWIAHCFGIKGPSYNIDTACSSSFYAIELAYRMMRSGECNAMIVAGSNLCLNPFFTLQFARLGVLAVDGFCRPFDVNAKGYMRSEAVVVVFLQKAKDAKRIYGTLVHAKTNCDGYKEEGITFPSSKMQRQLLEEFYDECGISPSCIKYIETHGTGTKIGDPEEVKAIEKVFCKDKLSPLLIGSVKSNMGHSEPASGLCQIIKVVIAMETGVIPPNIHFTEGRSDIEAFKKGTINVITIPTPWEPTLVGVNSFGFGGANAHILLEPNMKEKINGGAPKDDLPRLVVLSGRTEQAVESFLQEIKSQPTDIEYVRLLHDLYADEMQGHPYRGYTIVESQTSDNIINEIKHYSGIKKPICFVFSDTGSQWFDMGKALLRFPAFSEVVKRCDTILRTRGIHTADILTNKKQDISGSVLNSIVGITMMQLGLIDLLTSVNIMPDYVIGHSIGELCCGYVTGDFTIEQVILSAYYIGLVLNEMKIIQHARADINLDYKKVNSICPADIEVICSYSPNACSISGPIDSVKTFIRNLQSDRIFAKEVTCNNIPFHSSSLTIAADKILTYLCQTIPHKMTSSQIWRRLSWNTELPCAEYITNNLMKPVLFEDVAKIIPDNTVFVGMTPDGILQSILKKIAGTTNISLTQRNHDDNIKVFLQGLGKIYNCGMQPRLANLYPTVEFPVSRGTPMISPSIKWKHSDDWYTNFCFFKKQLYSNERIVNIILKDDDYSYMSGHIIDGKILLPATGYIYLVWETVGMLNCSLNNSIPVVFEDVKFLRATYISTQRSVELTIMVQKATGNFEIIEGSSAVVTGRVRVCSDPSKERLQVDYLSQDDDSEEVMTTRDIYKELKLRGYQYTDLFQGLRSSSTTGKRGHIAWSNNWVAFMDNMLQMQILRTNTRDLYIPTGIRKLVIDPSFHAQHVQKIMTKDKKLAVRVYEDFDTIISGGVEISGIMITSISRRKPTERPVLEEYKFVAHRDGAQVSFEEGLILSTHLVLEYHQVTKVNIIELIEDGDEITTMELASPHFVEILDHLPLFQSNISLVTRTNNIDCTTLPATITVSQSMKQSTNNNAILVTGCNLLKSNKDETLREILQALKSDGFLLTRGQPLTKDDIANAKKYNLAIILEKRIGNEHITLLKKKSEPTSKIEVIYVKNHEYSWLEQLKLFLNVDNKLTNTTRIILVGEGDMECGLLGLVNCLRKEPSGELIRGVFIQDENAPKFSVCNPFYAEQLQLDLVINVLRPGKIWGSYRHLPLAPLKPRLVHHAYADQMVRGDLSSFCWLEGPITPDSKNTINIIYASLNFKDVMLATGKINLENFKALDNQIIGFEYVGIDDAGRRLMGLYKNRCISNKQTSDENLSWEIPDKWSLEDAATVPTAYSTCYYVFYMRGKLKKSDKILIHSGTGAVGQAAIHIALHTGCEVFTTVGTLEKRKFIRDTFPSIRDDHIGSSRDTSFEQMIYQQTDGRGVNVVINSLSEDKLLASIRCLAENGHFFEIGKFDMVSNNTLNISSFSKGIQFYSVLLDKIIDNVCYHNEKKQLKQILAAGLDNGAVKPINRTIFEKNEIEAAFRYMATGKHIGKVIIKVQEDEKFIDAPILALPRYYCLPNKSYIILGGLGGFGIELVNWLVIRNVKYLVLVSRTGVKNGYQRMKIKQWKSYGVKILIVSNVDVSNVKDCEHILRTAENLAPTDAIFNLAVVLNDKICQNHTTETFQEPFKAKAWATENLDKLSRKMCPHLRHFVVFSSVSCGRGNAGQSNYGMSNSIMERICEKRSREGLHGLAIQWGVIGDVGLVADMEENNKKLVIGGTLQQRINSCIEKLEEFLLQEQPIVASMVVAEKHSNSSVNNVVDAVANIMGIKNLNDISNQVCLSELGMDSMMSVEIKQTLEREHNIFLTTQDIRNLNFATLVKINQEVQHEKLCSDDTSDTNDFNGLKLLVRVIGKDNLISDVCMNLPTKGDKNKNEIFLLPGIEGSGTIFNLLASKIEAPATCLQYGTYNIGNNYDTIAEIANNILKHMMHKIKLKRDFLIIAYSYGTLLAIELARLLEGMNLHGQLIFIDGAPEHLKALMDQHIFGTTRTHTDDELQNNVLLKIMDLLEPVVTKQLLQELNKFHNWDEKLNTFINHLPAAFKQISIDFTKAICTTIYKHICALQKYDINHLSKIMSPITLFKPSIKSLSFSQEDYGLHKVTTGNVKVHYVEGNHITILDNDKVVAAINGQHVEVKNGQL